MMLPRVFKHGLRRFGARARPRNPARILIAHHLLFGDTLCLTPLVAKCRERYPDAEICLTVPGMLAPIYASRPFDVRVISFDPRDANSLSAALGYTGFDLALIPGENRFAWLAQAMNAAWIVGFDGDRPGYKNWLLDERIPFPGWPWNWADAAALLVPGPAPGPYDPGVWPDPPYEPFDEPAGNYCVLHIGARNPLRNWLPQRWRELSRWVAACGLDPVWSAGAGEESILREVDPSGTWRSYAGRLSLAQLWRLLKGARLLVCPDTGVAHLGRVVGVPTVALFGPGSVALSGAGAYWRNSRYRAVAIEEVACRNQNLIFKREIPGMLRCVRFAPECTRNICMQEIALESVTGAARELLEGSK